MKTSTNGRALIKKLEGLRLSAYQDSVGVWTIGYGHTSKAGLPNVQEGMTLSGPEEADAILARDLGKFEAEVMRLVKVELNQNQFDALVSFTFNLGSGNLSRSTLLGKLNAGDYHGAAAEFPKWNRAGGKVLAGLSRRRAKERELFEAPVSSAPVAVEEPPPPELVPVTGEGFSLKERVARLQEALHAGGVDPGNIDGLLGRKTLTALQQARKLPATGDINNDTYAALYMALASV